jgi:hypothetical protein
MLRRSEAWPGAAPRLLLAGVSEMIGRRAEPSEMLLMYDRKAAAADTAPLGSR